MAGQISEGYLSRSFQKGRTAGRELIFDIVDTTDELEAEALIEAAAPVVYQHQVLDDTSVEYLGGGNWKAKAKYVRPEADDEYTFDTGGGTQKITQSLGTVNSYAPSGATPPDFQGAIGVTEDKVEGADIVVPQFEWTETHRIDDATMSAGYKLVLFQLTGTMNNATFRDLAAGECLFKGAAGSKRGDEQWAITYRFAASPNESGMTIGDITGIDKLGWDYLWIRYGDFEDSAAVQLVKRPSAVLTERVYNPANFSLLGI